MKNIPHDDALHALASQERAVVQGLCYGHQAPGLRDEDLSDPVARAVLRAVRSLQAEGLEEIDPGALLARMSSDGQREAWQVLQAEDFPSGPSYFSAALHVVTRAALLRRLDLAARKVRDLAADCDGLSASALEQKVAALLSEPFRGSRRSAPRIEQDRMADLLDDLAEGRAARGSITTPWPDLDRLLGGCIEAGNLVLIGARPSMGKSAFALQFARHVARVHGPVLFQSCEMSDREVTRRSVAQQVQANSRSLELEHVSRAIGRAVPLYLYTENQGVDDLAGVLASFIAAHPDTAALFVDYLGLLQTGGATQNTEAELSYISRSLKRLAERHGIPVIAVHQLNRGVESREDKRPQLSDLRGSGAIEQDANIVMFLFRPGYYSGRPEDPQTTVRIAKNRDGSTWSVDLHWVPTTVTFYALDERHEEPVPAGRLDRAYGDLEPLL